MNKIIYSNTWILNDSVSTLTVVLDTKKEIWGKENWDKEYCQDAADVYKFLKDVFCGKTLIELKTLLNLDTSLKGE